MLIFTAFRAKTGVGSRAKNREIKWGHARKIGKSSVDADGNISGTVSSVFPTPALRNGWIAGPNHTYYYPHPVEPGGVTGILCEPIALEQTELADGTPLYQVLQVFAEAIQAEPAFAAGEAWGVMLTNNEITTVS